MELNWKKEWVLPFESPWSILEKVKSSNNINTKQLLQFFGNSQTVGLKYGMVGKQYREVVHMKLLDHRLLEELLSTNIKTHTQKYIDQIAGMFPYYLNNEFLFRKELTYCEDCINNNHHSILNQFLLINECPYHLSKLESVCFHCKRTVPYLLPAHNLEQGFLCECGMSLQGYSVNHTPVFNEWGSLPVIKNEIVANWLLLSDEALVKLKKIIIFKPLLINNQNALMYLLKTATSQERKTYIINRTRNKRVQTNLFDEIYECIRLILHAFEKNLLNTILCSHRHCIKRFIGLIKEEGEDFPEICPFAYGYVFWKESLFNINPFFNDPLPKKRKGLSYLQIPFYAYHDSFEEFILTLIKNTSISIESLKWIISHSIFNLANLHFIEWLKNAEKYSHKHFKPTNNYELINHNNIIFSFLYNEQDQIIEYNESEVNIEFSTKGISCPYNNKKYHKFSENEFSHLPMRLALKQGSEKDKKQQKSICQD